MPRSLIKIKKLVFQKSIGLLPGLAIGLGLSLSGIALASSIEVDFKPLHFIVNGVDKTPINNTYYNNETPVPASMIYNGTTYIPIHFASDLLNTPIAWDASTQTIRLGQEPTEYLSDKVPSYFNKGKGDGIMQNNGMSFKVGYTPVYFKMNVAGKEYDKGIMFETGAPIDMKYSVNKQFKTFSFSYALDDSFKHQGEKVIILGDGQKLWEATIAPGDVLKDATINISGVQELEFQGSIAETPTNDTLYGNFTDILNPILKK